MTSLKLKSSPCASVVIASLAKLLTVLPTIFCTENTLLSEPHILPRKPSLPLSPKPLSSPFSPVKPLRTALPTDSSKTDPKLPPVIAVLAVAPIAPLTAPTNISLPNVELIPSLPAISPRRAMPPILCKAPPVMPPINPAWPTWAKSIVPVVINCAPAFTAIPLSPCCMKPVANLPTVEPRALPTAPPTLCAKLPIPWLTELMAEPTLPTAETTAPAAPTTAAPIPTATPPSTDAAPAIIEPVPIAAIPPEIMAPAVANIEPAVASIPLPAAAIVPATPTPAPAAVPPAPAAAAATGVAAPQVTTIITTATIAIKIPKPPKPLFFFFIFS